MSDEDLRQQQRLIEREARYNERLAAWLTCMRDGHDNKLRVASFADAVYNADGRPAGYDKQIRGCERCGTIYIAKNTRTAQGQTIPQPQPVSRCGHTPDNTDYAPCRRDAGHGGPCAHDYVNGPLDHCCVADRGCEWIPPGSLRCSCGCAVCDPNAARGSRPDSGYCGRCGDMTTTGNPCRSCRERSEVQKHE